MSNEVNRGVRLSATQIEYISFKVPRKSGTFSADLFPPTRSNEPAGKFDDYIGGKNLDPLRIELRPDNRIDAVSAQKKANFIAKIGAEQTAPVTAPVAAPAKVAEESKRNDRDEDLIKALEKRVNELQEELNESKATVSQLQGEVYELTQRNEQLVNNQH